MARLDELVPFLDDETGREVKHLRELEAWAYAQQPFKVGDEVVIDDAPSIDKASGWWTHREYLLNGSTGVIVEVYFHAGHWGVLFRPDVQWATSDTFGHRVGDRLSSFYFDPKRLRRREPTDLPLTVPADAKPWRS